MTTEARLDGQPTDMQHGETRVCSIGYIVKQKVFCIGLDRTEFVAVVEALCGDDQEIRDVVLPVAAEMPRFPIGTWLDETRGCGCVVGEVLVAADAWSRTADENVSVNQALYETYPYGLADKLVRFGYAIDASARGLAEDALGWEEDAEFYAGMGYARTASEFLSDKADECPIVVVLV